MKDGFTPEAVEQVCFYGPVRLGVFHRTLEPEPGIHRPSGIRQAELHDVTVGDDCLIEQVGCLSRYDIAKPGRERTDAKPIGQSASGLSQY